MFKAKFDQKSSGVVFAFGIIEKGTKSVKIGRYEFQRI
jgi:hypothetical protein